MEEVCSLSAGKGTEEWGSLLFCDYSKHVMESISGFVTFQWLFDNSLLL